MATNGRIHRAIVLLVIGTSMAIFTGCGDAAYKALAEAESGSEDKTPPDPPVADAGPDQVVMIGSVVTLDGTMSTDPQGLPLTYSWVLFSGPAIVLDDATAAMPTFTAPPMRETLVFTLTVDNGSFASDRDVVTINVLGAICYDTEIWPLWDYLGCIFCHGGGAPAGGLDLASDASSTFADVVALTDAANPASSLILTKPLNEAAGGAPHGGGNVFYDTEDPYYVGILGWIQQGVPGPSCGGVIDLPPTAIAGPDQMVMTGATVMLDGTGSLDPEGAMLTYLWMQTGGGAVVLSDPNLAMPTFAAPDAADVLTFSLVVNDGTQGSAPDVITITVTGGGGGGGVSYLEGIVPIWTARCTVCHSGASPAGGLDLSGGAASYSSAITRVNLADPPSSLLLVRPLSTAAGGSDHGGGDIFGDTTDPDYQTILNWISAGAPNN